MDSTNDTSTNISATSRSWANAVFSVGAVLTILVLVPFSPSFPRALLDSAYLVGLNQAVAQGLRFGRDIVFTYGPLAGVYSHQYLAATDCSMLIGSSVLAAALLLLYFEPRRVAGWNWPTIFLPIVLSLGYENGYFEGDAVLFILPLSFFLYVASTNSRGRWFALTVITCSVACGLLPLVKGSATVGVVICLAAAAFFVSRRSVVLAFVSITASFAAMFLAWLWTGQAASDLPVYFVAQLPLITGYAEAMSTASGASDVPVFVLASLLILFATWRAVASFRVFAIVVTALMLFLTFKASFVRHDGHSIIAAQVLMLSALYLVTVRPGRLTAVALACTILAALVSTPNFDLNPLHVFVRFSRVVSDSATDAVGRLSGRAALDARLVEAYAEIRKDHRLSGNDFSTDIYPNNIAVVFGNGLKWAPRPLLQSYIAYTPKLAELDAEYVEHMGAQRVYFSVDPIDGRYGALEDGPSWIPLLKHYRVTSTADGYLVMDRMRTPRSVSIGAPIMSATVQMGQSLAVPDTGTPVFARIAVSPSVLGHVFSLAYKPPRLHIEAEYADGTKRDFRFIGSMAAAGFVISPTIGSGEEFALMQSPSWKEFLGSKRVVSFRIFSDRGTQFAWSQSFHVELQPIKIQSDDGVERVVFPPPQKIQSLAGYQETDDCSFGIDGREGAPVLTRAGPLLHVNGWALISGKEGIASDTISIAVELPTGESLIYPAQKMARGDVASHFQNPSAVMSGFDGTINVSKIPGAFKLKIVLSKGGKNFVCTHAVSVSAR